MRVSLIDLTRPLFTLPQQSNRVIAADRYDALSIVYALYDSGASPIPLYGVQYLRILDQQDEVRSILLPAETDTKELFRLFVLFESSIGDPDPLAAALIIEQALKISSEDTDYLAWVMKKLNLPDNDFTRSQYMSILSLDDQWKQAAASCSVTVKSCAFAAGLSKEEQRCLAGILLNGRMTARMQELFLEMSEDLHRLNDSPYGTLWGRLSLQKIFENEEQKGKTKGEEILRRLKSILYPNVDADKKKFSEALQKTGITKTAEVNPTEEFESPELSFSIKAFSSQEFREKLEKLKNISEEKDFEELFGY